MEIILPNPHKAQLEVLESKARFKVMMCGRRFGKSLISQVIASIGALKGERIAYLTPTYLLAKVFFDDVVKLFPASLIKENRSDLIIDFPTGGQIRFFTGERIDTMRGLKFHYCIVDEAPYLKNLEDAWFNVVRPTLTDYKGGALFVSTPRGREFFYSLFLRDDGEEWKSWKFTTYDNPFIPVEEIDSAKRELPEAVFEQEYMANPMENAANPFGIKAINKLVKKLSSNKTEYIGIDLAKSYDWTVIIGLDKEGNVSLFQRFQKDWRTTKIEIEKLPRVKYGYIDATGVGDPIAEEACKVHQWLQPFKFTAQSKQHLMEGLQSGISREVLGYPEEVAEELRVFEYRLSNGRIKYEAPSGFHDDITMALAMAHKAKEEGKSKGKYVVSTI